jgi:AcrR family transcriptional regulator
VTSDSYHHGSLRQALLQAAVEAVAEHGPTALSLRDLARRSGVSHGAAAHHFGDKAGLLTALAAEGYELLADELTETLERTGNFVEVGVAYVRVAVEHRSHFEVMFRPDLYHADDPELLDAQRRTAAVLDNGVRTLSREQTGRDAGVAAVAAWSIVHGFASLWLNGLLQDELGDDPEPAARAAASLLFRGRVTPAG